MFKRLLWVSFIAIVMAVSFIMVEHMDWLVLPPVHTYAPNVCVDGQGPDHVCTNTPAPYPQVPVEELAQPDLNQPAISVQGVK